ncbi:hypothetical protein GTZ99_16515 [Novosphingobium sp. FSY-8]|uniref:Uncharacterized protein n=1 Tax=Novosphingobium ovatum TaxID=1908523 RepID=A0ABW9XHY7_9SPHN|nr:hypothetical protein [Novosphingobium ovatum]NBC38155.1 hypothetical protein [Novosphingobium ovatum]
MTILDPSNPTAYNHPARPTLNEVDTGALGAALLALTKEVWVLTDRMMVMEEVLAQRGIDISAQIDAHQPDPDLQSRLNARGAKLVAGVLDALSGVARD